MSTKETEKETEKVITEISIKHVSGVRCDNHKWALNNVVAFDASGSVVDTSFKKLIWFPQGHEVIVKPVSTTVKKIAFAVQDAKSVILGITWVDRSSGNIFSCKQVQPTKVVHWSSQPREGGPWKAEEDNDNHTHWSYTFVDLDNLDNALATTWTKVIAK